MDYPTDLHRSLRSSRGRDARRTPLRDRTPNSFVGRWRFSRSGLGAMLLAGIAGGLAWAMLPGLGDALAPSAFSAATHASFSRCHSGGGVNCVVDGDTFWIGGTKIRIADIDTPETHSARCAREAVLGEAATARLHALLNSGEITLHRIDRDSDRYGRKLRLVSVDGRGVGAMMVAEGFARQYEGGRRAGWC